jgi:GntR family histidine utilization transcriptional repressor
MPRYQRVKEHVLERIRSGEWPVGHRIPSENRLVETLGISRMTVNRAMRELADAGILARLQGVGTFVSPSVHRTSLLELRNIADEIRARGHQHTARPVRHRVLVADRALCRQFEDETLRELFHLTLVHSEDGVPVQIEDRLVNPQVAPDWMGQDFSAITPTEYLLGITPVAELEHVVRATLPSPAERDLLRIEATEPCLVVQRRSWSLGWVATAVTLTYPSSRYELGGRHPTSPMGTLGDGNPASDREVPRDPRVRRS